MVRFRQVDSVMRFLAPAFFTLSGCATHTTKAPLTRVVHLEPPKRAIEEIPSARLPVKAHRPEIVPTTQIDPCVFRGSLYTSGKLYSQATGDQNIVELSDTVVLERLELPTAIGGRAKVVVASPIQIEAYLDETEKVVELNRRVDIVAGHVWLDRKTVVFASAGSAGAAKIRLQFSAGTSPAEFVTTVPCADLSLPQSYHQKQTPSGDPIYLYAERIPIHESAGGREIAAIPGGESDARIWVWPIETKTGWIHVEGNEEFHFKGWIPASSQSSKPGYGFIGLLSTPGVTHQVTKPIPLRLEATDAAPVIAKAAEGAEILLTPGPTGYRKIDFDTGVSTTFFAREADLRGAVRLADGVEEGEPESPEPQEEVHTTNTDAIPLTPMPPPATILRPSIEKAWDLAEAVVHASLEEGARRIRKGDWTGASKALSTAVNRLSDVDFEAKIIGYALLGRACDRKGDDMCANTAYTKVLELAKNSEVKIKSVITSQGDAAVPMVARLLLARGEALFYRAEQKRKAVDAVQYPVYNGSGELDDILEHNRTKVLEWIKKKRPLLEEAELAYAEILKLDPVPPPAWVIYVAGRSGDIWSAFVYEVQNVPPVPSAWSGTGTVPGTDVTYEQVRTRFRVTLEEGTAPLRQHAAEAYKSCREYAQKYGVAVAEGKRCEERLTAMGVTP